MTYQWQWKDLTAAQRTIMLDSIDKHYRPETGADTLVCKHLVTRGLMVASYDGHYAQTSDGQTLARTAQSIIPKESKAARVERRYREAMGR